MIKIFKTFKNNQPCMIESEIKKASVEEESSPPCWSQLCKSHMEVTDLQQKHWRASWSKTTTQVPLQPSPCLTATLAPSAGKSTVQGRCWWTGTAAVERWPRGLQEHMSHHTVSDLALEVATQTVLANMEEISLEVLQSLSKAPPSSQAEGQRN